MSNGMALTPTSLAGLPGAPFTQAEVDAAVVSVVNAARWHIMPVLDVTVTLNVECREPVLRLPTRRLVSVDEIRDADTGDVIDDSLYRVALDFAEVRKKCRYWPHGYARIEVDMHHGYAAVPADLLPVLAEAAGLARRDQSVKMQGAGPFSVGYGADESVTVNPLSTSSVLARYTVWQSGL